MQSSPEYWSNLQRLCTLHIEPRLNLSFREALEEFNKKHAKIMYLYNKRDMANNMHVHIRDRVRANFHGLIWAHVIEEPNRPFMLLIVGEPLGIPIIVGIKFKKQTKGLRTANIQTQAVVDFNSQQAEYLNYLPQIQVALPIPDVKDKVANPPKGSNLIAGYTPDVTWTKFEMLSVNFPFGGRKVKLVSEFTQLEIETAANIVEMPSQEKPKRTDRVRRRRNTNQPTRTKLRKFISSTNEGQETNEQEVKKKKNERS